MKTLKQFRFVSMLLAVSAILLCSVSACKHKPCIVPNPLIQFGLAKDTFGVTPNKVPLAQTVQIAAFDVTGTPKGNFTVAPGQQQKMHFDTSAHRPIQLKFTYQAADGSTIAEDSLRINDIIKKGISLPDMDIIIGFMAPGGLSCPNPTTTLNPTITNEAGGIKKATFAWAVGDSFDVTLTCGSGLSAITKRFLLKPTPGQPDTLSGKVTIYRSNSYACSNVASTDAEVESPKSVLITAISDDCSIRGSNDGSTRTISIRYPSTCTITVRK